VYKFYTPQFKKLLKTQAQIGLRTKHALMKFSGPIPVTIGCVNLDHLSEISVAWPFMSDLMCYLWFQSSNKSYLASRFNYSKFLFCQNCL